MMAAIEVRATVRLEHDWTHPWFNPGFLTTGVAGSGRSFACTPPVGGFADYPAPDPTPERRSNIAPDAGCYTAVLLVLRNQVWNHCRGSQVPSRESDEPLGAVRKH